ncbi:carbohydrate ABC transporter permease [Paenibacillus mendelii]|uniref:Carbohydrate ABC transporter permease n=1 Tax=Paenibacillus mendelii TaxID=206163 RepID=A0ABV6J8H2_9BACL|nr:carbohydrate ABC transporter permease [Paenibacillus mendelii]MCQ6559517.1 carbohydrate ABC transporter permease [Paenibacillus mendelii]
MKRESTGDKLFITINAIVMFLVMVIVLYPLIYIISASISDPMYVNNGDMWLIPKGITFEGYERVFRNMDIWTGYRNTIFYTVVGTLINLVLTIPCAYALSRKDLEGRNYIMVLFIFTMFFSGGLIPHYLLIKNLGMIDTPWALLLPGAVSVWNIIITRTFFQSTIPRELEEAAEIDGCSNGKLFVRIILPLSAPIIAVMGLFYGVGHWNSYFGALIFLSDRDWFPLQLILREILIINQMSDSAMLGGAEAKAQAEQARIAEIVKYAVIIVSTLPVIAAYPFMQRFFVKGVMIGSVKG